MQDKKPVYVKYFASELKITFKGKKKKPNTPRQLRASCMTVPCLLLTSNP